MRAGERGKGTIQNRDLVVLLTILAGLVVWGMSAARPPANLDQGKGQQEDDDTDCEWEREKIERWKKKTKRAEAAHIEDRRMIEKLQSELTLANEQAAAAAKRARQAEELQAISDPPPRSPPASLEVAVAKPLFRMNVYIFTYKRLPGLKRIYASLLNAHYPKGHQIDLTIYVDNKKKTPDKVDSEDYRAMPQPDLTSEWIRRKVSWPHGSLRVHRREKNAGLKRSIMEAWYPMAENEFGAFFEDDTEVSPYWYQWVEKALKKYYFVPNRNPKFLGLSLYRPVHDEITEHGFELPEDGNPFLFQQPCSWGAVYFPLAWREFRDWFPFVLEDPKLPFWSPVNSWFMVDSWKKFLLRHTYDKGLFMVYPNLPERMVLSTNHLMKGMHNLPPKEKFELPLLDEAGMQNHPNALKMPSWEQLKVVDMRLKEVNSVNDLPGAKSPYDPAPFPTSFD